MTSGDTGLAGPLLSYLECVMLAGPFTFTLSLYKVQIGLGVCVGVDDFVIHEARNVDLAGVDAVWNVVPWAQHLGLHAAQHVMYIALVHINAVGAVAG